MRAYRDEGYRLRRIRPRVSRREVIDNLWVQDVESGRVERSAAAEPVWVRRVNKLTGLRERVLVDEVNDVPMAWHYLPSSEVVRLLAFVRRDPEAGLTACEKRWLHGTRLYQTQSISIDGDGDDG
jgi:ATP:corrinoid adenosyltransferase